MPRLHWLLLALGFALVASLPGCSTFTTPLRDCRSMCGANKATLYESNGDGEKCQCGVRDGQAI